MCGQLESAYVHRHGKMTFFYDFVVSKFQAYNHCDANYLRLVALDKCVLATLFVDDLISKFEAYNHFNAIHKLTTFAWLHRISVSSLPSLCPGEQSWLQLCG